MIKRSDANIFYTVTDSPLGDLLLAATSNGICALRIGRGKKKMEREFKEEIGTARIIRDDLLLNRWVKQLNAYLSGEEPWPQLPYDVEATAFQRRVWDWLRTIPAGSTVNYAEVARAIGHPRAVRAVARACATNPVALVIPCHRIVPKSGGIGGYRWEPSRKRKLLDLEKV